MEHEFDSANIECLDEWCRYCGLSKKRHKEILGEK